MAVLRTNKYGVADKSERTYNGKVYHSKAEMKYRIKLEVFKKAVGNDKVLKIEEQVTYPCVVNDKLVCKYILDFRVTYANRTEHIDVKGVRTVLYITKRKLVEALYPITIIEVK